MVSKKRPLPSKMSLLFQKSLRNLGKVQYNNKIKDCKKTKNLFKIRKTIKIRKAVTLVKFNIITDFVKKN